MYRFSSISTIGKGERERLLKTALVKIMIGIGCESMQNVLSNSRRDQIRNLTYAFALEYRSAFISIIGKKEILLRSSITENGLCKMNDGSGCKSA